MRFERARGQRVLDATAASQAAVDYSRDHQMACYFPAGTYLVSDTIECLQRITVRDNGRISGGDAYPCILIGAGGQMLKRIGERARREIEVLLGARVFLKLWVKVRPKWRQSKEELRRLGYLKP